MSEFTSVENDRRDAISRESAEYSILEEVGLGSRFIKSLGMSRKMSLGKSRVMESDSP